MENTVWSFWSSADLCLGAIRAGATMRLDLRLVSIVSGYKGRGTWAWGLA